MTQAEVLPALHIFTEGLPLATYNTSRRLSCRWSRSPFCRRSGTRLGKAPEGISLRHGLAQAEALLVPRGLHRIGLVGNPAMSLDDPHAGGLDLPPTGDSNSTRRPRAFSGAWLGSGRSETHSSKSSSRFFGIGVTFWEQVPFSNPGSAVRQQPYGRSRHPACSRYRRTSCRTSPTSYRDVYGHPACWQQRTTLALTSAGRSHRLRGT